MNEEFDFIALGDIVTDAFIELKDARVDCDIDDANCRISMRFGDKIPYKNVTVVEAVGNSPNAATSASRLGLKTALITDIGDDEEGKKALARLQENGIDTQFVRTHEGMKTNYHYVLLYDKERTILIKHEEYPYEMQNIGKPKWIYLSSLGENSLPFHHTIAQYLKDNPEVKLAFQPGTFQIKLGYEELKDIYEVSEVFFCNKEEAQRILKIKETDEKKLLEGMYKLGPNIVVITDGPKGAYTYDGKEIWHMPMYPDIKEPIDRTGAGDAFSSTFTSSLALGLSIPEALARGPINSMNVVQYIGAQEGLLPREKLEEYLTNAPKDYKATKLD